MEGNSEFIHFSILAILFCFMVYCVYRVLNAENILKKQLRKNNKFKKDKDKNIFDS